MDDTQRPSRPARSQRRTRQESIAKQPAGFDMGGYRQNSLERLDDGTFGEINSEWAATAVHVLTFSDVLKHVRNEWAYVMEPDVSDKQ